MLPNLKTLIQRQKKCMKWALKLTQLGGLVVPLHQDIWVQRDLKTTTWWCFHPQKKVFLEKKQF